MGQIKIKPFKANIKFLFEKGSGYIRDYSNATTVEKKQIRFLKRTDINVIKLVDYDFDVYYLVERGLNDVDSCGCISSHEYPACLLGCIDDMYIIQSGNTTFALLPEDYVLYSTPIKD